MEPEPANNLKGMTLLYTTLLFISQIAFGLSTAVYGPSLVDLSVIFSRENEQSNDLGPVSLFFTFFCGGCITGSFYTSLYKFKIFKKYLNRQFSFSIIMMIASLFHSFIPLMPNIGLFYLAAYGSGFGLGTFNAICTTWLMEMWQGKRLSSILQASQFMYGVGSIFSPIMVKPFLHGGRQKNETTNLIIFDSIDDRKNDLRTPFFISGALEFGVAISILVLFFLYRYRQYRNDYGNNNEWPGSSQEKLLDDDRHKFKRICYHSLITFIFAAYNLTEIGFSSFQNAYFQKRGISTGDAANLASIGSAAYTLGRLFNVVFTRYLAISLILCGHLSLAALGFITLYIIQDYFQMNLWALIIDCIVIGYAQSAVNPALFGFSASYASLDDRHNSIYYTALGLPMLFAPFIIGPNMEKMPSIVLHLALGPIILSIILFIIILLIIKSARRSL